jgi:ferrochelatase
VRFETTFQSRFGPAAWLEPSTDATLIAEGGKGTKRLVVAAPGFAADCVETLEEINIGLREMFLEHGGEEFTYIPCLNDSAPHIQFLAGRIKAELGGWV